MVRLFGRYEYAGELGRGASGRVVAALDHAAGGTRRAIKVVPEAQAARLIWEFARLCQVDHPRIARVHELVRLEQPAPAPFGLPAGTLLLVEDFVEGAPLSTVAAGAGAEPGARLELAARVALGLGAALTALHDVALVHGDVKPDNVLCDPRGEQLTLIDLGFARPPALGAVPRGTPAYMAPELFAGVCTPAADVYALGALLYDLVCGELASAGSSVEGVPWRARDLSVLTASSGEPLRRLLGQLLAPNHADRPPDARSAMALLSPTFTALGLARSATPLRYAGLTGVRSARERAERALTLPFVGRGPALERLVGLLGSESLVLVCGARGAGRSRLVREAIRVLQERRAQSGAAAPTWVSSLEALALLRDIDAIAWLEASDADQLAALVREGAAAKLALRSLCLVVECAPGARIEGAQVLEAGELAPEELTLLVERLLAPERPSRDVIAAARASSLGLAGRLCELASALLLQERDLADARVWRAYGPEADGVLSAAASQLATALAWWGRALTPPVAARLLGDTNALLRAYDELRVHGLLIEGELGLELAPNAAARKRADSASTRSELAVRLGRLGAPSESGFARVACEDPEGARAAFAREARALRVQGRSDAAAGLLREALAWVDDERLRIALADAERAAGRYPAALRALEAARSPEAALLRAELLRLSDQPEAARGELEPWVAGDPAPRDSSIAAARVAARARAQRARLEFDAGELARAREDAEAAGASDDREAQVRGLEVSVLVQLVAGDLERAPADLLVARAESGAAAFDAGSRSWKDREGSRSRVALPAAEQLREPLPEEGAQSMHRRHGGSQVASSHVEAPASFLARAPARALALRAQVLLRRGERPGALADLRTAVERARALGEAHETATYVLNLGLAELEGGELGRALETLREAAQRLAHVARTRDLGRVLFNFAALALLIGDFGRAELVLSEAERELARGADHVARALVSLAWAELLMTRGALEASERALDSALAALPVEARAATALTASRAVQVALARGALDRAEALLARARAQGELEEPGVLLELSAAELRIALARGDLAAAEAAAQRGLTLLGDGTRASFAERLRFVLATVEAARAASAQGALAERTSLARAWLERALATLPGALRAKMRAVPAYARVLTAGDYEQARENAAAPERWRALVRASRRLFAETRAPRVLERLAEVALELVHAERALVIVFEARGELAIAARAELSAEGERSGFSRSVVQQVALEGQPLMTLEARADARLDRAASVAALSVRSVLCAELFGLRERAFLYLDDRLRPAAFGAEDLALIQDLVELARQALRTSEQLTREARRARRAEQQQKRLTRELARSHDARERGPAAPLVGDSPALARVIAAARRVALSDAPILITGESGTGKELLARFMHDASPRRARAFVAENCAAIPDTLLESALFGHVRGAFTGADRARKGLFEAADGGTLLLDEVGEMSPALQSKLLRVLQEGELRPVGSERTRAVDVRVLAATRRDLRALVQAGRFREDLFYRLAVVTLELPALRERAEDVPPLIAHFLDKHAPGRKVRVHPSALRALETRAWPGNVRELENEVRRALALCDAEIDLEHLSQPGAGEPLTELGELDLHSRTEHLTRQLVHEALARADGNVTRAALLLGISRFGLQKIVKRLRLAAR